ncbi:MAG: L,D-transpeptidase family protein [Lachnospiraceae bacterium]|nr:L,D-transpeptidase family protein [Lachnospiraceae bacterium]MEE3461223.1 L,D-transpeptidase family protein [Lachnospiraceae bacterium]
MAVFCLIWGLTLSSEAQAADASNYKIMVNRQANTVTVYKLNKKGKYIPVRAMLCSTGTHTPFGTYKLNGQRYAWRNVFGGVWAQYATRIEGHILFHSVPYLHMDPSTLEGNEYEGLGKAVSMGCVRLNAADARWIYLNIKSGTTVTFYDDKDPGPLGKPRRLKRCLKNGWDPADIWSKDNPYNKLKPSIKIKGPLTVTEGNQDYRLMKGVRAVSSLKKHIGKRVKIKGYIDINTPGTYEITYSVTDELGRKAKKSRKVIVEPKPAEIPDVINIF